MNIKAKVYVIVIAVFLTACSGLNFDPDAGSNDLSVSYDFNSNFAKVWKAVLHALSENEMIMDVTKTMDDTVGVIVTGYIAVDSRELKGINIASEGKIYKYSYMINLYAQNAEKARVKIVVSLRTVYFGFYKQRQFDKEIENYLREKLFKRICNNLFLSSRGACYNVSSVSRARGSRIKGNIQVFQVQNALRAAGYKPGVADGFFGKKTRRALQAYQKNNNLPVTGEIDENTLKMLGVVRQKPAKEVPVSGKKLESSSDEPIPPQRPLENVTLKEAEVKGDQEESPDTLAMIPANLKLIESGQPEPVSADRANQVKENEVTVITPPQLAGRKPIAKGLTRYACTLWSEPSTTGDILADIPKDFPLEILEKVSFFYRVKYQGTEGFVYSYFVKKNDEN